MLRRQTAAEFPNAASGDALRELRDRRAAVPAPESAATAPHPEKDADGGPTLAQIDHLVDLHDRGDLSDSEFAAAKTRLMNGS